jgi:hypothetical protein
MSNSHNPSSMKYIVGEGFFFGTKVPFANQDKDKCGSDISRVTLPGTLIQSTVQTQQILAYSRKIN